MASVSSGHAGCYMCKFRERERERERERDDLFLPVGWHSTALDI